MTETDIKLGEFGFAGDDHVVPFEVAALDARGRVVQLAPFLTRSCRATRTLNPSRVFWRKRWR